MSETKTIKKGKAAASDAVVVKKTISFEINKELADKVSDLILKWAADLENPRKTFVKAIAKKVKARDFSEPETTKLMLEFALGHGVFQDFEGNLKCKDWIPAEKY